MAERIWVLVADSSRARVLTGNSPKSALTETRDFVNPKARLHERELKSDEAGRQSGRVGTEVHSVNVAEEAKTQEIDAFARELAQWLREQFAEHRFDRLYLVAPPAFLGRLRRCLDEQVQKRVFGEIAKEFTTARAEAIRKHLPKLL